MKGGYTSLHGRKIKINLPQLSDMVAKLHEPELIMCEKYDQANSKANMVHNLRTTVYAYHWDGLRPRHCFPPSHRCVFTDLGKWGFSECLWVSRLTTDGGEKWSSEGYTLIVDREHVEQERK